jgi:cytochrome P450
MVHDDDLYPTPEVFDPTRFLDTDGAINGFKDPRDFTFGFGRR